MDLFKAHTQPPGVFVQTQDQVGWVLFDGRHELSIGASVVDVAKILQLLQDEVLLEKSGLEKPLQMQNCPLCGQSKINPDKPEKT